MRLKIGIVLNSSWNAYNFRKGLILRLIEEGHDVLVIAPKDEYVAHLISWGVKHISIKLDSSGLNPIKDVGYLFDLIKILKKERPDIILTYTIKSNIYGSWAAKILRILVINNVSGLGSAFLWKGWIRSVAVTMYNQSFRYSNFIFFQNSDDRALFLQNVKVSPAKTGLLPGSGIDLAFFKSKLPDFRNPIRFLMISRLIVEKGVLEYVQAAKILSEKYGHNQIEFQLMGKYEPNHKRGIELADFERIRSGEILEYFDHMDDVKSMIAKADVVVLPSYREGTPRTLLEAAAMSRPLITTDVAGCREVVVDGSNGFLSDPQSAHSLAAKMELFLALSNQERNKMAIESRKLAESRFDENIVIMEYLRKINQLVN